MAPNDAMASRLDGTYGRWFYGFDNMRLRPAGKSCEPCQALPSSGYQKIATGIAVPFFLLIWYLVSWRQYFLLPQVRLSLSLLYVSQCLTLAAQALSHTRDRFRRKMKIMTQMTNRYKLLSFPPSP